mgnify:CR=1 FL=1
MQLLAVAREMSAHASMKALPKRKGNGADSGVGS